MMPKTNCGCTQCAEGEKIRKLLKELNGQRG